MNKKLIKRIVRGKLNKWIKTITDPEVKALAEKNTILTGGAIANLLLNEPVKDYDVYFRDKKTTLAVAKYYIKQFNEANGKITNRLGKTTKAYVLDGQLVQAGVCIDPEISKEFGNQPTLTRMIAGCTPERVKIIVRSDGVAAANGKESVLEQPFEDAVEALDELADVSNEEAKDVYEPVFLSTNAITLSDKIQIVVRFYGEPDAIHENYDFIHCTNYYDHGKDELVLKPQALECLINKELRYVGSKYPVCSIIRTRKFLKRGFHINAGQYLKMCFQVSNLDLTNIDVLEDQLVGVDSAYFMQLIDALRTKKENDPNFGVDENYVTTIIDRIF